MSGPWDEFPMAAQPAAPAADPWAEFPHADSAPAAPAPPSVAADVAKSGGVGLAKGAIGVAGAPGTALDFVGNLSEWAMQHGLKAAGLAPADVEPQSLSDIAADNKSLNAGTNILPRADDLQKAVTDQTGPMYEPKTTAGRYAETVGEFVPGAALTPGGSVAGNLARGALSGLGSEAAGEAAAGTGYEPAARIAGAFAAPGAAGLASRAITPLPIDAARQGMVDTLRGEGVPLTTGQVTGNKPLRWAESTLGDLPLTGGRAAAIDEAQKGAFTGAALQRIGSDGTSADPATLLAARTRIGDQFNDLSARNTATFDPQFAHDLGSVLNEYDGLTLPNQQAPIVQRTIDGISQLGGSMPGPQYQAVRSNLDKAARSIGQSNPPLSGALFGIRNALDGAMTRSITPEDQAAWQEARNQWRNWKVIEKAATGAGENAAQGNISPAALRSATVAQNRGAYATGQGDFGDLSRAGVAVMSPLPNSGTAPRAYMMHLMSAMSGGAGLGAASGGAGGAMLGAAAPLAPSILGRLLMSRPTQAYLGNQVMAGADGGDRSVLGQLLLLNSATRQLPPQGSN